MAGGVDELKSIGGITPRPGKLAGTPPSLTGGKSFKQVLEQTSRLPEVRFSAHALERIQGRNIWLSPSDLDRLNQAVEWAAAKGAQESLVVLNDLAFLVSVKNRTVITTLDQVRERVFTQIDSAVIL